MKKRMIKMNILIASMCLDIGGAETHVVTLASKLKKYGHTPIVVSSGGIFEETLRENGIEHYLAPLDKKSFGSISSSVELIKNLIKQKEIDIIHAHGRIPAFNCKIVSMLTNTPFMTTAHAKFKDSFVYRHTSFWGKKTICISDDVKEHLVQRFAVNENKITVIENGIDTDLFSKKDLKGCLKEELGMPLDSNIIINTSRIKGLLADMLENIIEAVYKAKKTDDTIQLVIAGDGDDYDRIKAKVNEFNTKNRKVFIHMLGKRKDIDQILNEAVLYIGVARSALEAMSTSLPVIIAGGEGYMGLITKDNIDNAVENNFTGRKNSIPFVAEEVAKDINYMLGNEEYRNELGRLGRKVVEDKYSLDKKVYQTIDLYKSLIKECK